MQIPYTGSGVRACAISMDKYQTKELLRNTDVVWPRTEAFVSHQKAAVPVPCVVKIPRWFINRGMDVRNSRSCDSTIEAY